jgi:hypothetical protein
MIRESPQGPVVNVAERHDVPVRMIGPYALTFDDIRRAIPDATCGVYSLGYVDADDLFRIQRVGRDDRDLRSRLTNLIGTGNLFKFYITVSAEHAFILECRLFHRFRPPANVMHPDRPSGSGWCCPVCLAGRY